LMDVHKHSTQIERLEVVETGRRRRWTDAEKLRIVLESMQTPRAISSMAMRPRWRGCFPFWSGDDPGRGRCADLDCQRPHRHEERYEWPGVTGAGGPWPRSVRRRRLRVPRSGGVVN